MEFSTSSPDLGPVGTQMEEKLLKAFEPVHLQIIDESHKHAGHAAMRTHQSESGETHFKVVVVSDVFDKKMPIERHRAINECLEDEIKNGVHALSIEAKTIK